MTDHNADPTRTHISLAPGTMVSHYRIVEKIGAGGMGEVYLAEDTKLDRRVALKFMPSQLAADDDLRARFMREAQAAARLDHPNIVTVHEVDELEGRPFIAMQYVEGKTLHRYCHQEPLPVDKIVLLAQQVSEGLAGAHKVGVTHRDIKSANIIVDRDFRAKILDFGLATVRGSEMITKEGTTLGTIAYMSPEQARGRKTDHRSDLFSLGAVIYELIAGRTPFKRDHDAATLHAIINESAEPLARFKSDVPTELERIVMKCLAKNPGERYQSAADLAVDLRSVHNSLTSGVSESSSPAVDSHPSIAVLPFANMSADRDNEFFADGLTEELLNVLAKNPELKVTGRTSSFSFKGKQEDLREIGNKLGVATILEGSVRKAGKRIRITAQLVNSSDGFHLWSETYDRVLEDIFEVQDEIAGSVAKALHLTLLGPIAEKRVMNAASYELVLQAQQVMRTLSKESALEAIGLYQEAIQLEPNDARAWAGLARVHLLQAGYGLDDNRLTYRRAKDAALKALELDDTLADAHEVMGLIRTALEFHFEEAGRSLSKAYELAPNNSRMVSTLSLYRAAMGDLDEAIHLSETALELDPLNPETHFNRGRILSYDGRYDEARTEFRRVLELSPGMTSVHMHIGITCLQQGNLDDALSEVLQEKSQGYRNFGLAVVYHALGKHKEADEALSYLLDKADSDGWAFQVAMVYSYLNDPDNAFKWLEFARTTRDAGIPLTKVTPILSNLHDDPRWPALLARIGFS
ncbi:MAG: protein kinase [Candidatus Zixiibacteriota bacterium]